MPVDNDQKIREGLLSTVKAGGGGTLQDRPPTAQLQPHSSLTPRKTNALHKPGLAQCPAQGPCEWVLINVPAWLE